MTLDLAAINPWGKTCVAIEEDTVLGLHPPPPPPHEEISIRDSQRSGAARLSFFDCDV